MKYKYYVGLWSSRGTNRYRYFRIIVHERYYKWNELMLGSGRWLKTDWYYAAARSDKRFSDVREIPEDEFDNFRMMQELIN